MRIELPFRDPAHLPAAAAAVRELVFRHGVAAVPTETFYGLAADPHDARAVERVFALKGRPAVKALLVVGGSLEDLETLVDVPPPWRERLAEAWPAPLTAVLPLRPPLPAGGGTSLAVRVPDHVLLRLLLSRVGPLTATSANRTGEPPPSSPDTVRTIFPSGLDLLLDGGDTPGGAPSTVLDCTGDEAAVLRAGAWSVPHGWPMKRA